MSAKAFGFLVVAATIVVGSVAPASAEFFGCNEPRTKVSYSSPRAAYSGHYAQAPRQRSSGYSSQSYRRLASQGRSSQWH